jgi:alpha-mannosidase
LVQDALQPLRADAAPVESVLVFNTCSWPRSQLVTVAGTTVGDRVTRNGEAIPSQRLSSGELAFVARDIPGLSALRYDFSADAALAEGNARVDGMTISNGLVAAVADPKTGTIKSFTSQHTAADLVNTQEGNGLNEYMYVPGTDPKGVMRSGSCTVTVKEAGPVVATMVLSSGAPSANSFVRELRVVDGLPYLLIRNTIDKHKQRKKEGVHVAFPFNVPDGTVRVDLAWSVIRADQDQLPASCKNWITAQRWADVSNSSYGVTWATLDAPLVELGSPTAESPWIDRFEPTQTIVSYLMNNYWHTNYRDSQEGPHVFRYALQPHGAFSTGNAQRFGIEQSQPLIVTAVKRDQPDVAAPLVISPRDAFLTAFKRSDDGQATVARLFSASGKPVDATIARPDGSAPTMWLSDMSERKGGAVAGPIAMPAFGVVTVRIEE